MTCDGEVVYEYTPVPCGAPCPNTDDIRPTRVNGVNKNLCAGHRAKLKQDHPDTDESYRKSARQVDRPVENSELREALRRLENAARGSGFGSLADARSKVEELFASLQKQTLAELVEPRTGNRTSVHVSKLIEVLSAEISRLRADRLAPEDLRCLNERYQEAVFSLTKENEALQTVGSAAIEIVRDSREALGLPKGAQLSEAVKALSGFMGEFKGDILEYDDETIRATADDLWRAINRLRAIGEVR